MVVVVVVVVVGLGVVVRASRWKNTTKKHDIRGKSGKNETKHDQINNNERQICVVYYV